MCMPIHPSLCAPALPCPAAVAVFEAKISGGSSIAFISRDAFRVVDGMDMWRQMSYFNTGAG